MGCEYCHYARGHHPQCPEAEGDVVITYCTECKEPIIEGDTFYWISGRPYCAVCVNAGRDIAERDTLYEENVLMDANDVWDETEVDYDNINNDNKNNIKE